MKRDSSTRNIKYGRKTLLSFTIWFATFYLFICFKQKVESFENFALKNIL